MTTIRMIRWKSAMQKVSLTMLQIELLKLSLKDSKENVDKLLNGEVVDVLSDSIENAEAFIKKAFDIGVECILL